MTETKGHFLIATDDTLRETVSHGNGSYPFAYYLEDIWDFDFHRVDWHWHHEVEFLSVKKGTALCSIGKDRITLHEGSGLFVNSGILHRYDATGSTIVPNIVFSPALLANEDSLIYQKYIAPVLYSSVTYQILNPQADWQNEILLILEQIYAQQDNEHPHELQTLQQILRLWEILSANLSLRCTSPAHNSAVHQTDHRQARLLLMMQYIHDHYQTPVTLDEIAASASISKSSALTIFQSGIHTSPIAYLIQYRLRHAATLLNTTKKPIISIAEDVGFTSAGYFCRKFKEHYGISPGEYRANPFPLHRH